MSLFGSAESVVSESSNEISTVICPWASSAWLFVICNFSVHHPSSAGNSPSSASKITVLFLITNSLIFSGVEKSVTGFWSTPVNANSEASPLNLILNLFSAGAGFVSFLNPLNTIFLVFSVPAPFSGFNNFRVNSTFPLALSGFIVESSMLKISFFKISFVI